MYHASVETILYVLVSGLWVVTIVQHVVIKMLEKREGKVIENDSKLVRRAVRYLLYTYAFLCSGIVFIVVTYWLTGFSYNL